MARAAPARYLHNRKNRATLVRRLPQLPAFRWMHYLYQYATDTPISIARGVQVQWWRRWLAGGSRWLRGNNDARDGAWTIRTQLLALCAWWGYGMRMRHAGGAARGVAQCRGLRLTAIMRLAHCHRNSLADCYIPRIIYGASFLSKDIMREHKP